MKIISGFEPTRIITKKEGLNTLNDVLENTLHLEQYETDLDLVKEVGIDTLRIAIPWHRIESIEGIYDWEWTDKYMDTLRDKGIDPILDPLHHVSIPSWLSNGFLDEKFVETYCRFFINLVNRYTWVNKYTIVNEPLVTTYFSTHEGIWYPFTTGHDNFKKALDNIERIIYTCSKFLENRNKEHWYVEPAEYHTGVCEEGHCFAQDRNFHRFQLLDRLTKQGTYITVLGLDYYSHCEFAWDKDMRVDMDSPVGFYSIAKEYLERYQLPIALTETNIRGFAEDRLSWFIHMYEQCQRLIDEGVDFRGFCWYPFIDCTDWDSLLQQSEKHIDPQGIIVLDTQFRRHKNLFSDAISDLIKGKKTISEIERFQFRPPLNYTLKGFIKNFMNHWEWKKVHA